METSDYLFYGKKIEDSPHRRFEGYKLAGKNGGRFENPIFLSILEFFSRLISEMFFQLLLPV